MSDKLDPLFSLLKDAAPNAGNGASEAAKKVAISKALKSFDKKNKPARKGIAPWLRPIDTAFAGITHWIRSITMKKATIFAGGTCLGVLAFGLVQLNPNFFVPPKINTELEEKAPKSEADVIRQANKNTAASKDDAMLGANVHNALEGVTAESEFKTAEVTSPPAPPPAPPAKASGALAEAPALTIEADKGSAQSVAMPSTTVLPKAKGPPSFEHRARIGRSGAGGIADTKNLTLVRPAPLPPVDIMPPQYQNNGTEKFDNKPTNPVKLSAEEPVSTFSTDVDTASYALMRSSLNNGNLPSKEQVRVEELVNYFPYNYQGPTDRSKPFKANVSVIPTPWNEDTKLMHIGIKGYDLKQAEKPRSNLVFLIDTSGSMNQQNKLPLLINSFKLLLNKLDPDDRVAIVTYAGSAGVALESTPVSNKDDIINALENLSAGGSTAGAAGIERAYQIAEQHKIEGSINRVILATDGDFNVGMSNQDELKSFIEKKRKSGIFLSILGFGRGNYNDALMQTLAQHGNGNASYIDTLSEAQKVLVDEAASTLFTIAKDVKIQVEFNPATVAEYRLIGYETRMLNREDFNNDKIDAGDIGAGHSVTALYEITPVGAKTQMVDELRYQKKPAPIVEDNGNGEYAFVKMRYKLPDGEKSTLITTPVGSNAEYKSFSDAPIDTQFATSVAAFGQQLRGGEYIGEYGYDDILSTATTAKGDDLYGYRAEFIKLVRLAKSADNSQ